MHLQEKINNRQNDEDMLKCQFAARHYYNAAEKYCALAFGSTLLSCLCILLPSGNKPLALLLPLLLDVIAFFLYYKMGRAVSAAARLRNYFDDTVLCFNRKSRTQSEMRAIQQLVHKACSKNEADCLTQIANTGRDNPPGVKNWYEFSKEYTDSEVVFECQTQNQWWNKRMILGRLIAYITILLVCVVGFYFISNNHPDHSIRIFVCVLSLFITLLDRAFENGRYFRISIEIEDDCKLLSSSKNKELLVELQQRIESRRELRVVELNLFHKTISKKLSEEYEQISKEI